MSRRFAARSCVALGMLLTPALAEAQIANGSFESGDFAGWIAEDTQGASFDALAVRPAGSPAPIGTFFTNSFTPNYPVTDGSFSASHGFDGSGGVIRIAQDVFIDGQTLVFDWGAAAQMSFGGALDRDFSVNIRTAGGGSLLDSTTLALFPANSGDQDSGIVIGEEIDVSAHTGTTVRIEFLWTIPESNSGPGGAFLDNVMIIDVPTPTTCAPMEFGFLAVPPGGSPEGIAISGTTVYLANAGAGLQIVDVSDAASPVLLGSVDTPGNAVNVTVSGSIAYVTDVAEGLQVVDVSDPMNPVIIGSVDTPAQAVQVAISGSVAYVSDVFGGLQPIEISDPTMPTLIGVIATMGRPRAVVVSGSLAYVADDTFGFTVIDVSDPSSPVIIGSVATPGGIALDLAVSETMVLLTGGEEGLHVIDVSDPANPTIAGTVDTPGSALRVVVSGTRAYVADGALGLQVIDLSDPTMPTIIGSVDPAGVQTGVQVLGSVAYVSTRVLGLNTINIGDCVPLSVAWATRDGGGSTVTGGKYTVSSTIGQPDTSAAMGPDFSIRSGFWEFFVDESPSGCNAADLSEPFDTLDFDDVLAFLVGFGSMDPVSDLAPPAGVFDFDDILAFLTAFGAGCP